MIRIKPFLAISFVALLLVSCTKEHPPVIHEQVFGNAQDIDGNHYQYTEIKGDIWFTENLTVATFRNGDTIMEAKNDSIWHHCDNFGIPAWCYYDNDSLNGEKYGKMYTHAAIVDPRGLAPEGWHIATESEWMNLCNSYGGEWEAGKHLKSESGWLDDGNGTNDSYFNALPGGQRFGSGNFYGLGTTGRWWTGTQVENAPFMSYSALLPSINYLLNITNEYDGGYYVRCVKD